MVCGDVSMSAYKIRHPDDTDDPPDVGLSSDDEATGIEKQIGIAQWITVSHPERSVSPSYSQGRAATPPADDQAPLTSTSGPSDEPPASFVRLGPDEVVIRKAVLCGIKRGAELALKDKLPASFSAGSTSAGDVPFAVPKPGKDLASRATTMEMHQNSCGSQDYPHNCATCGKGYHSKQALLQHLKAHQPPTSVEEHTCPDCK